MKLKRILSSLLVAVMLLGMIATASVSMAADMPFKDVPENEWFYDYVKYVYENKLMSGTSGTTFDPRGSMTRAMFVTVLGRLAGVKDDERLSSDFVPDTFSDTVDTEWYASHTAWAQKNSIILGNNGKFNPDDKITREEGVAIIIRYINLTGVHMTLNPDAPGKFSDAKDIAEWFTVEIDTMRRYGIVTGNADGTFNPKGNLSRAEGATILRRLDERLKELTYEDPYKPDYSVEGKDYLVMGAWDINYAALGTNTSGQQVEVGTDYAAFTFNALAGETTLNWMNLTERDINIEDYPFVRVGYTTNGTFAVSFAQNKVGGDVTFYTPSASAKGNDDGVNYLVMNVAAANGYEQTTGKRFMRFESTGDTSIAYAAFFKTEAEANAFDFGAVAEEYKTYDGAEINYVADADKSVADKYLAEAADRVDEILNSKSELTPADIEKMGGTCYYVSSINGDDNNDGKSPETAWKTPLALWNVKKVGFNIYYTAKIKSGDGVFFERGSVFDASSELYHFGASGDSVLVCQEGAYYGAYGEGPKPIFANSVDYYGQTPWVEVEENIWRFDYDFELPVTAQRSEAWYYHDVGNIVLTDKNGNEGWGIKITNSIVDDSNLEGRLGKGCTTVDLGIVADGFGNVYDIESRSTDTISDVLKNNLEFYHEFITGQNTSNLYMYYDGDLNEDFESIVVANRGHVCVANAASRFDNLSFEYGGSHGISTRDTKDMLVKDCVFKWIGGSLHGSTVTRFGNAIENWEICDGFHVIDCYIYQMYDTGITSQGNGDGTGLDWMNNMTITGNVISHTIMPLEFFNYQGQYEWDDTTNNWLDIPDNYANFVNMDMSDNYILYTGYGFGTTRSNRGAHPSLMTWMWCWEGWKNCNYTDNVVVYSTGGAAFAGEHMSQGDTNTGLYTGNNVYVMNKITYELAAFWGASRFGIGLGVIDSSNSGIEKSERGAGYLANLGMEMGSEFYNIDEYVYPEEAQGGYVSRIQTGN